MQWPRSAGLRLVREDTVPIVLALAALPAMALLLMAVSRVEGSMNRPRERSPR